MTSYRFPGTGDESQYDWAPLPFRPASFGILKAATRDGERQRPTDIVGQVPSTAEVLRAFDDVSRRMENLARSLGCLGYFDEDDDGPRAA